MQSLGGTYDGCQGFSGDIVPILEKLSPAIEVVLSGHTHQAYDCILAGPARHQRRELRAVCSRRSTSRSTPSAHRVVEKHARNVPITRDVTPDADVARIVQAYADRARASPDASWVT